MKRIFQAAAALLLAATPVLAQMQVSNPPAYSAGSAPISLPPSVSDTTSLAALATANFPNGIWRRDYATGIGAPPLFFLPETGTCAANSRVNDGGSCVNTTSGDGNSFYSVFPNTGIDPREFGAVNTGAASPLDDTAINAAIAVAAATGKPFSCNGNYGVAGPINLHGTAGNFLSTVGKCVLTGYASSPTSALLDVSSYVTVDAELNLYGAFNPNYARGIWLHTAAGAPTQYTVLKSVKVAGFLTCWVIGDRLFPAATVSENSIIGGATYGCPIAMSNEGTNTVTSLSGVNLVMELGTVNTPGAGWYSTTSTTSRAPASSGSITMTVAAGLTIPVGSVVEVRGSALANMGRYMLGTVTSYSGTTLIFTATASQDVGGPTTIAAWLVRPHMAALVNIGGSINITAGELQSGTIGHNILMLPLEPTLGGGSAQYGTVNVHGESGDVAGNLVDTLNPSALAISTAGVSSMLFVGKTGFNSNDVPFIYTDATYNGLVALYGNRMFFPGGRTSNTVTGGSALTVVENDGRCFGPDFVTPCYSGITGATVVGVGVDTGTSAIVYKVGGSHTSFVDTNSATLTNIIASPHINLLQTTGQLTIGSGTGSAPAGSYAMRFETTGGTILSYDVGRNGADGIFDISGNATGQNGFRVTGVDGASAVFSPVGSQIGAAPTGGAKGINTLNLQGALYQNGVLVHSPTAPTIASGGCTTGAAQSVSGNNGTAAFEITLGGATCGSTITMTMPAAANNWQCDGYQEAAITNYLVSTGAKSTTAVVLTNVVRTTGVAGNFTGATLYVVKCISY